MKKAKQLTFTPGIETSGKIPRRWWSDGEDELENYDNLWPWALIQEQMPNSRQNRALGCFSVQLLKILKLKLDAIGYRLNVLCPHSPVDKRYGQIVWPPFPHPTNTRGRWGSQVQKISRMLMVNCTLSCRLQVRVYMKYNFGLDAMTNPRKSIFGDTVGRG